MSGLTLLIIRHGEKPKERDGDPDYGAAINETGAPDDKSLVVRGWQRAGTWAVLFGSGAFTTDYPKPHTIYAANPDKQGAASVSWRPLQTVKPLCDRLSIAPNLTYGVGDEAALISELNGLTGTVLVGWEHKMIGGVILPGLFGGATPAHVPKKWDRLRFDVVLRLDRIQPGAAWSFRQLFPQLLAGDSAQPMGSAGD
jgi:hypothetical protein